MRLFARDLGPLRVRLYVQYTHIHSNSAEARAAADHLEERTGQIGHVHGIHVNGCPPTLGCHLDSGCFSSRGQVVGVPAPSTD